MNLTDEDKEAIIHSISIDPHITADQRQKLINSIRTEDSQYRGLINGALGASIGYAIGRYLKLSKTTQVVVTLAGFGIGKYLLDNHENSGKFMEYDKKLKGYKLNT